MKEIKKSELEAIACTYEGRNAFTRALNQKQESPTIFHVLTDYIGFNAVFAGSVLRLAGRIANEGRFKEKIDKSHNVAAFVFKAAIDEFNHPIHRELAQETLLEVAGYFDANHIRLRKELPVCQEVISGYETKNLFRALGFHLGSEFFADQEFKTLDTVLKEKHPDLVGHLKRNNAYAWIAVHTIVEAAHSIEALNAANAALKYQVGQTYDKSDILSGFNAFGKLQENFMKSLYYGR